MCDLLSWRLGAQLTGLGVPLAVVCGRPLALGVFLVVSVLRRLLALGAASLSLVMGPGELVGPGQVGVRGGSDEEEGVVRPLSMRRRARFASDDVGPSSGSGDSGLLRCCYSHYVGCACSGASSRLTGI